MEGCLYASMASEETWEGSSVTMSTALSKAAANAQMEQAAEDRLRLRHRLRLDQLHGLSPVGVLLSKLPQSRRCSNVLVVGLAVFCILVRQAEDRVKG